MDVVTSSYTLSKQTWSRPLPETDSETTLVAFFGAPEVRESPAIVAQLRRKYPRSIVVGCSTSGEIAGVDVTDGSLSVAVTRFEATRLLLAKEEIADPAESFAVGAMLARKLRAHDLKAIFVLSEGLHVNGSELVRGLNSATSKEVVITGGLAGDGTAFGKTWVFDGTSMRERVVVAVGLYGDALAVSHGSRGGWTRKGKDHTVTLSRGNEVLELDGRPALDVYEEYVGPDESKKLPASGLLFPLSMTTDRSDTRLTRTLLAIDRGRRSLTFAGDVPMHAKVAVMEADFERLVEGARDAGRTATVHRMPEGTDSLTLAISCVGRRLVLKDRAKDEVAAVRSNLPPRSHVVGFYSYGEISPFGLGQCDLHNQTMTLTVLAEDTKKSPSSRPPPRPSLIPAVNLQAAGERTRSSVAPSAPPPRATADVGAPTAPSRLAIATLVYAILFAAVATFVLTR